MTIPKSGDYIILKSFINNFDYGLKIGQEYKVAYTSEEKEEIYIEAGNCSDFPIAFSELSHFIPKKESTQVGGDHYKSKADDIRDFCYKNEVPFCESNIMKYTYRHKKKGGKQDLLKAIEYIEYLIKNEYPDE